MVTRITGVHGIGNYSYMARSDSIDAAADMVSGAWSAALSEGLAVINFRVGQDGGRGQRRGSALPGRNQGVDIRCVKMPADPSHDVRLER